MASTEPHSNAPPVLPSITAGAALGALGGVTFGAWEVAVLGWAGLPTPDAGLLRATAVLYVVTGAFWGGLAGALRRTGVAWALVTFCLFAAWLLSGKVGMGIAETGGFSWFGPLILVPVGLAMGLVVAASELNDAFKLGAVAVGSTLLVLGLPVNLHLLGSPTSSLALTVDGALLIVSVLIGSVVAMGIERFGLVVPLVVAALVGTGGAALQLDRAEGDWPIAEQSTRGPLVLVIIDTLRADHLGAYGYGRPTSPNLDAAARRGVLYTDVTAAAPWTLPSVGSLLTGVVPAQHGAGVNLGQFNDRGALRPAVPTIAARLRDQGYTTVGITTNPWLTAPFGFHRGFDRYDDAAAPAAAPAALHPLLALGLPIPWPTYRDADTITDRALAFVGAQTHRDWFLLVHYMDVHGPHHPDAEDVAAVGTANMGPLVDAYDASIHEVDRAVGRLLAGLPRSARVVITADHGEELTERRAVGMNVPRGTRHGHTMYQEQLHVPLIVLAPGLGGRRVSRPVSAHDIPATLLALGRAAQPERPAGAPLPEIVGGAGSDRAIFADSIAFGPEQQVARRGTDKLVRIAGGGTWLYDLAAQPLELEHAGEHDADVKRRVAALKGELPAIGVASVVGAPTLGAQLTDLLARLGYVEVEERSEDER